MIFLGKSKPHDTYFLFDGRGLVLTRSIRRVDTNWKSHLEYYLNFTVHTTASVASVSLTQNYVHDIPNM